MILIIILIIYIDYYVDINIRFRCVSSGFYLKPQPRDTQLLPFQSSTLQCYNSCTVRKVIRSSRPLKSSLAGSVIAPFTPTGSILTSLVKSGYAARNIMPPAVHVMKSSKVPWRSSRLGDHDFFLRRWSWSVIHGKSVKEVIKRCFEIHEQ